jgi:tetratricopeptide (TPR) repeat protein
VERSLVAVEISEPSRYRLLWTVRAFAFERARAAGELDAAARRHRDHYIELGEQVWRHMIGPGLAAWLVRARADQDNFRAALRWSLEQGHGDAALQLASALVGWWFRSGQLSEGLALLERSLALADEGSPWRPRALMGRALLGLAAGVHDAAAAAAEAVVACERAEPELLALALVFHAQTHIGEDRLDEAEAAIERARPLFASLAHPERHSCDQWLGVVRRRRGDLDSARDALVRAVEGYRQVRKPLDAGWSLVELTRVELAAGRVEEAQRWASDAVRDFRRRGDPRGLAAAFTCLGRAHAGRKEETRARLFLDEALEIARRWEYRLERDEVDAALRELDAGVAGPSRI